MPRGGTKTSDLGCRSDSSAMSTGRSRVRERPLQFPTVAGEVRRALLHTFPGAVYFRTSDEVVVVLAVLPEEKPEGVARTCAIAEILNTPPPLSRHRTTSDELRIQQHQLRDTAYCRRQAFHPGDTQR
jgi:hypothetical protein